MTKDFKLGGLGRPKSFTCNTLDNREEIFWPENNWSQEKFDELWNYIKATDGFWNHTWIAEIEYSELSEEGIPIDGLLLNIKW